jgi:serine/threonine-protein kinase
MAEPAAARMQFDQARYLLFMDELTGVYNRRFYDRQYVEHTARAAEDSTPLGMMLIDVDFFKDFNDRHGHQQGDEILAAVGRLMNEVIDMYGYPIRYGGDEFAALLPTVSAEEALKFGQELCARARELTFRSPGGRALKITLSVGVAHYPGTTANPEALFENADAALYAAKRQGRDRAVAFKPESEEDATRATLHRFPCPTLIGRITPLGEIIDRFQSPISGAIQWIVVGGDAGIGKSRLLQELRERATRHGHVLLQAPGTTRPDRPLGILLDALSAAVREHPSLGQSMAAALSHAQMRQIVPMLPELARYALLSSSDDNLPSGGGSGDHEELVVRMMSALCAHGRVTLIADDAHLADAWTINVLERLDAEGANMIACLALRDDEETKEANPALAPFLEHVQGRPGAAYLRLQPFNRHEVARMMDAILKGSAQERPLLDLICERSRGIPLLVEELLKFLVYRRIVSYRGAHLEVHDLDEDELPSETELLLEVRAAKAVPLRSIAAVTPRTAEGMLRAGALLNGRYVIERVLARGGMSVVYRATMPSLGGRPVAVKEMLMPSLEPHLRRRAVEQFQREAQMLALLDHPNLVEVIDYFEEDDSQYLVMSYIDGETLEQWLRDNGTGEVARVVQWLGDLCDVLCYLHAQSPPILFRDLKPASVMVDHHGRLRLIDFGIAQALDIEPGTIVKLAGTPGYAPLEQLHGVSTDPRSDIYALGATAYTLLTGTVPPAAAALESGGETLVRPRELNPKVPPALDHLVHQMMSLRINDRPESANEVRTRVQQLLQMTTSKRPMVRTLLTSGMSLHVVAGADNGVRFLLAGREILIGRGEPGQISTLEQLVLHDPSVSREQATLKWDETKRQYVLSNHPEATNRTLLNGRPVTQQAIGLGDTIRAGHFEAIVALDVPEAPRSVDERPTEINVELESKPVAEVEPEPEPEPEPEREPVGPSEVAFTLRVLSGEDADVGSTFQVRTDELTDGAEFVVGGPGVLIRDFPLRDSSLLGAQLTLVRQDEDFWACPPTGDTRARINGKKLEEPAPLADGDTITWGRTTLLLNAGTSSKQRAFALQHIELPARTVLETHELAPPGPLIIGRKQDVDIHVQDPGVSRMHAQLEYRDGSWFVQHLSQTNPTLVNGVRLMDEYELTDGDEIQVGGNSLLRFVQGGEDD